VVDGKNYAEEDPFPGHFKRLRVTYYFDGGSPVVIERPEHARIVLPEDTFLYGQVNELQKQLQQVKAESLSVAVNGKLIAGPAAFDEQRKSQELAALLSPLQIEALTLAKELRDFIAGMPPFPDGPKQQPGEDDHAFLVRHMSEQFTLRGKWDQKLKHAYVNRGIGPRITSFLHRFAEAFDDAPVGNASYAEDLGFPTDDKTIPKLAQQMEMIAVWINRKERGEVNLLK
jgi:hypothetical protein